MTIADLIAALQRFPTDHDALVYIQFVTKDGRDVNMGELCDIEDIFPGDDSVTIYVDCQAWDSAFDKAMIEEQFIDEDGNVTGGDVREDD